MISVAVKKSELLQIGKGVDCNDNTEDECRDENNL